MASLVVTSAEDSIAQTQTHGPAQLAASGPRASGNRPDYELLMETIYEGYLLHLVGAAHRSSRLERKTWACWPATACTH